MTICSASRTATPVTPLVPAGSFPSGRLLASPRQLLLLLAWMLGPRMLHDLGTDSFSRGRDISLTAVAMAHAAVLFGVDRSEEHTSELQSLMRISYAVFCLKKKKKT